MSFLIEAFPLVVLTLDIFQSFAALFLLGAPVIGGGALSFADRLYFTVATSGGGRSDGVGVAAVVVVGVERGWGDGGAMAARECGRHTGRTGSCKGEEDQN